MKKFICILLSAFMLVGMCTVASAQTSIEAKAEFSFDENAIIVSGIVNSARANIKLALEINDPNGKLIYADETVAMFNESKTKVEFKFKPIVIHPQNMTGTYTINVSGNRAGNAQPISYEFEGADNQLMALKAVVDAQTTKNDSALSLAIGTYGTTLGIDNSTYGSLGADGVRAVNQILYSKTYTVPTEPLAEGWIATVQQSLNNLRTDFANALIIGEFNDVATDTDIKTWLTSYGSAFDDDDPLTDVSEDALYSYIAIAMEDVNKLSTRILSSDLFLSMDEIRTALYEQSLLSVIENRHFSEGKKVFEKFPSLFSVNLTKLNSLSEVAKGNVYANVKGAYSTVEKAGNALNALIDKYYNNSNSGNNGHTGGSSYSGSSFDGFYVGGNVNQQTTSTPTDVFEDLKDAEWARTAVEFLTDKGILSGDGSGKFYPNNDITRSEFIKLVVLAVEADMNAAAPDFLDVDSGAWYRPYVNAARAFGLVQGDMNNCFNPNALITREDMAVMVYRCYKISGDLGYKVTFADSSDVSSYAGNAVAFLSEKKIINGVGNNKFMPKANATRAEAIQIIYNMLKNVK